MEELGCKLEAAEETKTQMDNSCRELQERADKLSSFVTRCQQAIDSASAIDILRCNTELSTEAKKLLELEIDNYEYMCPSLRVVFTPTNLRQYLPQIDSNLVGTVNVDDASDIQSGEVLQDEENKRFPSSVSQYQQKGELYTRFLCISFYYAL